MICNALSAMELLALSYPMGLARSHIVCMLENKAVKFAKLEK